MTTRAKAECRGCGKELQGDAYMYGGRAYITTTRKYGSVPAPSCHYGGFVCSESCDRRTCLSLERTMPGHGQGQNSLNYNLDRDIISKWNELRRDYPGVNLD